jgi:hypothetical protein
MTMMMMIMRMRRRRMIIKILGPFKLESFFCPHFRQHFNCRKQITIFKIYQLAILIAMFYLLL